MSALSLWLIACTQKVTVDADGDGVSPPADCDDGDRGVYPGAPERCDGVDQDCGGRVDDGFDLDGDGFNTALDPGCAALGPTDCDDTDPEVSPAAAERCNGVDDDCDGELDPQEDADDDGATLCDDCDDTDASVRPGGIERCDGLDNDCNGASDEPFDADGDGVGACLDCDDAEPVAHPGALEVCDSVDNDCDGERDEGFDTDEDGFTICRGDCNDTDPDSNPWAPEQCNGVDDDCDGTVDDAADLDGDGFFGCSLVDPDCDDLDPATFPGAAEACDGVDNDCDGALLADEGDGDGDGVPVCGGDCDDADPLRAQGLREQCDGVDNDCDPGTDETVDADLDGLSTCGGDCDDAEPLAFPGGVETCNGVDDDCNGTADDGTECVDGCTADTYGGHGYLFCPNGLDWVAALSACRAIGYDLVALGDAGEEVWVSDTALTVSANVWWSGFNDRALEGDFVWSSGEPVSYSNWAAGEPNNSGEEDCAQLLWSGYAWNDAACGSALPYVCETL
ncbi:MAG: MopE-related protein [Myxococcota bacterium]